MKYHFFTDDGFRALGQRDPNPAALLESLENGDCAGIFITNCATAKEAMAALEACKQYIWRDLP